MAEKKEYEAASRHLGGGRHEEHKKDGKDGKDGKKGHKVEIRVRPGHAHGFIAAHHKMEDGVAHPTPHEEHPLPDKAAMLAHMDEHTEEGEPQEQAQGGEQEEEQQEEV